MGASVAAKDPWAPIGPKGPTLRRPRVVLTLAGQRLVPVEVETVSNSYFAADTFRAVLALHGLPKPFTPRWFSETERMEVEVLFGFDPEKPQTSLILGRVDEVEVDWVKGVVSLQGRDYTADLIETKTTEKWPNRTASEIAEMLAGRHGLTPVVTATTQRAGRYYQAEHAQMANDITEWALLSFLAEQEGFDVFVRGRELHFEAPPDPESDTARLGMLIWDDTGTVPQSNMLSLRTRRVLTLSRDITVRVISWNGRQGRAIRVTRRAQRARRTAEYGGSGQVYVFRVPGLTEEQAIRRAEAELERVSRFERQIEGSVVGDTLLFSPGIVRLKGTGSDWDQDYWLDEVSRRISMDEGFVQTFRAKNHSPQSQVSV